MSQKNVESNVDLKEVKKEDQGIGHGFLKRYQTGFTYIPADLWRKLEKDGRAEYVEDMQAMLVFNPDINPKVLMKSIELITLFLETEIDKREIGKKE